MTRTKQKRTVKSRPSADPQESLRRALSAEYVIESGASSIVGQIPEIKDSKQANATVERILQRAGGSRRSTSTA